MKLGIGVLYKKLSSTSEINKNRPEDSLILLNGGKEFIAVHAYFLIGIGQIRYGENQYTFPVCCTLLPVWIKTIKDIRYTHIYGLFLGFAKNGRK
jgi:hypothetical protein